MADKPPKLKLVSNNEKMAAARNVDPTAERRMVEIDWSILMARAQDGDAAAYRKLLVGISPYVRSLARGYFQNPSDAEDALQDVLITIHVLRATYDPLRPFGPWLKTIANRKIIDRLRVVGRHRKRETRFTDDLLDIAQPDDHSDLALKETDTAQLLNHLPYGEAQALRLTKLEGLSLEQASAASGQSIVAIKVATHRALKRLKRILGKEPQE